MKELVIGTVLRTLVIGASFISTAYCQEIGEYMSYTWDQSSGTFYAYSQVPVDYEASYYYSVCTQMILWQTPGSYSLSSQSCSGTDAEVNWYTTVSTSPVIVDLEAMNLIEMYYMASQFGYDCDPDDFWDAYQANFLDNQTYSSNQNWYLPGPPGVPVPASFWVYEYAEAALCGFTISPGTIHSNYCSSNSEQSSLFQANVSPSLSECIPVTGSCSAANAQGDISLDGTTPSTCSITDYSITGHVNYYGPQSGYSGSVDLGFNLTFAGHNVQHTNTVEIVCP